MDQARRSGASWTEIGAGMGVSKQAAQKRFVAKEPDQDFGRYSNAARSVLVGSMNEARAAGSPAMQPAHLILGVLAAQDSEGARILTAAGVTRDDVLPELPPRDPAPADPPAYDARARKVLELTFREAFRLGHERVGTGHLVRALLAEEPDDGLLHKLGVTTAEVTDPDN